MLPAVLAATRWPLPSAFVMEWTMHLGIFYWTGISTSRVRGTGTVPGHTETAGDAHGKSFFVV